MKIAILTSMLLASIIMLAQDPHMHIYRNDGGFTTIHPLSGLETTHNATDSTATFQWSDSTTLTLPLSVIDSCRLAMNDIPVLNISLIDYPEATSLWEKDLYLKTRLDISGHGIVEDMDSLMLKIKGRGNSTWAYPKKPMRLKFDKKTSICGFRKSKNYVLLANYLDNTHMKNVITLWLAQRLQMPYANSFLPVDVVMNGHALGLYTMTEKIGINSTSVDIDENTGILFELSDEFDENFKFRSEKHELPVMVKDPDFEELYENDSTITPGQRLEMWRLDFNNAERMASEGRVADVFDITAAVKYFLVNNFAANSDLFLPRSFYMYKENLSDSVKYKLGPIWDFDVCYNLHHYANGEDVVRPTDYFFWTNNLLNDIKKNEEFRETYKLEVENLAEHVLPEMLEFLDSYAALIEPAAKRDGVIWPREEDYGWTYRVSSYNTKDFISELREWIVARVGFLLQQAREDSF